MTAVTYTAKRSLIAGHIAEQAYALGLRCMTLEPNRDDHKTETRALSGKTETLLWRFKRSWQISTAALRGDERLATREFLDSVIGGETFEFDELGTVALPVELTPVILVGLYNESRAVRVGDGGADDYFRFAFAIREA